MSQKNANLMPEYSFPLFVPGDKPERIVKAWASGCDAVIIDLEDAVDPANKDRARADVRDAMANRADTTTYLRINSVDTQWYKDDVALLADLDFDGVVLAKAETATVLQDLRSAIQPGTKIIALVENALGLANVRAIAADCDRIAFGSIDYCADLGIAHTQTALLHARSEIVLASRLAEIAAPIDGVTTAIKETSVVEADAVHSSELGFAGKMLIHPAQISPARQGFYPSEKDIHWAERVIKSQSDTGAASLDGHMVDAPVLIKAQKILSRLDALK